MKLPLNVDFSGKVAVITGAGGVLCSAFAKALAQCGAKVAVLDLNLEAAQKVADELAEAIHHVYVNEPTTAIFGGDLNL